MSDGAAFVMIVSENMLKKLNVEPIAKLIGYSVAGLPPKLWVWDQLEQFQRF